MERPLLAMLATTSCLAAQDMAWDALLRQRIRDEQDLIELRYRRDEHGLLEVASCEFGAIPFQPLFPGAYPMRSVTGSLLTGTQILFGHGSSGILGCTDSERHLRRAGIEPSAVALRQFLVAPWPADAVRARVELLDRMVAIEWLQRGGHQGAVAELMALTTRADTPPPLAARAALALEAFGKRSASATRRRLDAETLPLPTVADAYLVVDHGKLPDLHELHLLARRLAVDASYRVVETLAAPTPDDLYFGQWGADLLGEVPFEIARRYGNMRFDHTVVALLATVPQAKAQRVPFGWNLQAVGEFEHAPLEAALREAAAAAPKELQCEPRDGAIHVKASFCEAVFGPTSIGTHSKGMGGRARPELARELLAEGPAVRVVIPSASKLWPALTFLALPPAERLEVTASFGEELRVCLTLTARDEDAADAWAERGKQLVVAKPDEIRAAFEGVLAALDRSVSFVSFRAVIEMRPGRPLAALQPLVDAIAATKITTDGAKVEAVLTSRTMGWPLLWALRAFGRAAAK
ncbi:MAG TPA: hypothetical protein VF384_13640 [Planctomycetota bacterium]